MAHGAGLLIAGASSFVRTSWQQLRTGEADGAGQDAGDAAAAGGSTAAVGEKPDAARAERQREVAEAVAYANTALRREMEAKLHQAKAEATTAMEVAVQQHAAEMKVANNSSKVEAAAAEAAETTATAKQAEAGQVAEEVTVGCVVKVEKATEAARVAKAGDKATVTEETKMADAIDGNGIGSGGDGDGGGGLGGSDGDGGGGDGEGGGSKGDGGGKRKKDTKDTKTAEEKSKALRDTLKAADLSNEEAVKFVIKAGVDTLEKLKTFSIPEMELVGKTKLSEPGNEALAKCIAKLKEAHDALPEDEDLPTIKARTMYKMVEDVEDSKAGIKKLLFLSSKQADLIARDPSAIDKMLGIFLDKQQPKMVINLLPSMIRCWTRVRPLPEDPDGEREGLAALDRFMAEHIIPLAEKTHAIILCSAVQPFCVLSESLSRMLKLVRSRWGSELPFTILSCTGVLPALYTVTREGTTWRGIRNLSRVWKKREKDRQFVDAVQTKLRKNAKRPMNEDANFDLDLDPNGTNFIIVDPTSSSANYDSYNKLINEIVRKLAAELPSIAIQTGKSKFSNLAETNASGIEVALSNMETGTPVLMLDLTKRPTMTPVSPMQSKPVQSTSGCGGICKEWWAHWSSDSAAVVNPEDGDVGPAARRQQQIEWHRAQVENEERRRIEENVPDYDWDVCMISHFHDGVRAARWHPARTIRTARLPRRTHNTHRTLLTHGGRHSAL